VRVISRPTSAMANCFTAVIPAPSGESRDPGAWRHPLG
jgi:hypothetical protein